jgi:hypothetical protein
MQVSATLIAAQQAAREARARLQMPQAPQAAPAGKADFAAALGGDFTALPLKTAIQTQAQLPQPGQPAAPARMGQHIDITI